MVDIFGMIIDLIPSFIKSRLCSKEERKQKHLEDIKKEVLQPILNNLNTIYIPILEKQKEIIMSDHSYGKDQKVHFRIIPWYNSEKMLYSLHPRLTYQKTNETLYNDIKKNHFRELIKNFEDFDSQLKDYTNNWISYSEQIFSIINDKIKVPLIENFNMNSDFINTYELAGYVINDIYGIQLDPIRSSGSELSIVNNPVLKGTPEKIQKCLELIIELKKDDSVSKKLNPIHKELLGKAYTLQSETDKIIKTYKLSGNCEFV